MRRPEEQAAALELRFLLHDAPFSYSKQQHCRDERTLLRRFAMEGFSFLSKALPALASELLACLSGNRNFTPQSGFKSAKGAAYPRFLGAAFERVLLPDGSLRPPSEVCYKTVKWLLTFLLWVYKAEVPFNESQIEAYSERFEAQDSQIGVFDIRPTALAPDFDTHITLMRDLLGDIFRTYASSNEHFAPKFGPGINSDTARVDRYHWTYSDLVQSDAAQHFGLSVFMTHFEYTNEYTKWLRLLLRSASSSWTLAFCFVCITSDFANVLFVPKDSRGPRVIACEPSYNMWVQQAVRQAMQKCIESHWLTQGQVNFDDQSVNQALCFVPNMATLDLKDASDLISLDLVKSVFPTSLLGDMLACRTKYAVLPGPSKARNRWSVDESKIVRLNKFAPMGSALCFPTMSIVNFVAIVAGEYLYSRRPISQITKEVFVYGDDIVVPSEMARRAIASLHSVGLRVNEQKSFIGSRFLESCGEFALDGHSVRPLRRRQLHAGFRRGRQSGREVFMDNSWLVGTVDLANSCWREGYASLAFCLSSQVEAITGPLPPRRRGVSGYLGWDSDCDAETYWRQLSSRYPRFSTCGTSVEHGGNSPSVMPMREFRIWVVRDATENIWERPACVSHLRGNLPKVKGRHKYEDSAIVRRSLVEGGQEDALDVRRLGMRKPFYALVDAIPWYTHLLVPRKKQNFLLDPGTLAKGK